MDWSKLRAARGQAHELFRDSRKLKIIDGGEELIIKYLRPTQTVLDIGAHDRRIGRLLQERASHAKYYSFDIDRSLPHDYYDFDEIDTTFDMVVILDVIEHLTPDDTFDLLVKANALLKPGGKIIVTTPNVSHPNRLWRDCTHITPFHYKELAGFLISAGFNELEMFRVREMTAKDWLMAPLAWPLLNFLEIDYTFGIASLASKPTSRGMP